MREVGQDDPRDGPFHADLLRADAVIADVTLHLLAMSGEKIFGLVEKALGLDENQRMVGFEKIINGIADDFELAGVIGIGSEAERLQERFKQFLFGGFFRFLLVETANFESPGFSNQVFQFGEEFIFSGFSWHGERVCAE